MARVEMIDRDPVEFRSQILFHLRHQPARERLQVVILFAILRRDDEAELVAIARLPLDKCLAVRPIALGRVELTAFTIAGDAVALDVTQMRAGRAQPLGLVEPDDPRLHHDAAVAPGGEPVAARELPARDIAARDAAAGKGTGDAACSARQSARLTHPLKIGARCPAPGVAWLAKPRLEIVLVPHRCDIGRACRRERGCEYV